MRLSTARQLEGRHAGACRRTDDPGATRHPCEPRLWLAFRLSRRTCSGRGERSSPQLSSGLRRSGLICSKENCVGQPARLLVEEGRARGQGLPGNRLAGWHPYPGPPIRSEHLREAGQPGYRRGGGSVLPSCGGSGERSSASLLWFPFRAPSTPAHQRPQGVLPCCLWPLWFWDVLAGRSSWCYIYQPIGYGST